MKRLSCIPIAVLAIILIAPAHLYGANDHETAFHRLVVEDRQGFGYEAFRLIIPRSWKFSGGVSWNFGKTPPEASTAFTVSSPDNRSVYEQNGRMNMFYSQDPGLCSSRALSGSEILKPMAACDFLKKYYIPRCRKGVSSLKIRQSQTLEALARQNRELACIQMDLFSRISPFGFPYEIHSDAARVQVEYIQSGRKIIEDFTVTITYMVAYYQSTYGNVGATTWIPVVASFHAPADEMDRRVRTFKIITDSRKDNPHWTEDYIRLCATIARDQIRRKEAVLASMRKAAGARSEISDMISESYAKRNEAYDRIFDNYSDAVRSVDSYVDPINDWEIELPTSHDNAWTNGFEYIFSDDAGFDPNIGSSQQWTRMGRKHK